MFGYVRVSKPELRVKEYELYRSTYCGLCRSMGKCTGQCSRMTLSYDFVFLALIRMSLMKDTADFGKKSCIAHPLQKRSYMKSNPTLRYCSGAAALLNYHKVKDDLSDEKGVKKLSAVCLLPFVASARRKAIKKMGLSPLDKKISEDLQRLSEIEKTRLRSVDEPAKVFGELLGDILSYGTDGNSARISHALGMSVGKWIYIADALDDWNDDAKKERYNPFILLYGKDSPDKDTLDSIRIALKNELCAAEGAVDLMSFDDMTVKNIIENILYLGLPARIDEISDNKKTLPRKEKANDRSL